MGFLLFEARVFFDGESGDIIEELLQEVLGVVGFELKEEFRSHVRDKFGYNLLEDDTPPGERYRRQMSHGC